MPSYNDSLTPLDSSCVKFLPVLRLRMPGFTFSFQRFLGTRPLRRDAATFKLDPFLLPISFQALAMFKPSQYTISTYVFNAAYV